LPVIKNAVSGAFSAVFNKEHRGKTYMIRKLHLALFFIAFLPVTLWAQNSSMSGKVRDNETGELLPGANIVIKQLSRGTSTDVDGYYFIDKIPAGIFTIEVSYVGFKSETFEIQFGTESIQRDFGLTADFLGLDEVVVTGVGAEISKKKLSISVESVTAEQLLDAPAVTLDNSLTGKIAGATITPSGSPGAPAAILLRGINTMGNSQPMILIDGVQIDASSYSVGSNQDQVSRLADIDFNDIERVEVVKGASAATLYGAQGANGVIQIFTKSGRAGITKVSYGSTVSFDYLANDRMIDRAQKHGFVTDANGNILGMDYDPVRGLWSLPDLPVNSIANKNYTGFVNGNGDVVPLSLYDNMDNIYRTGITQSHRVSVSGGNDNYSYLASLNQTAQEGIERGINFDRLNFRLNSDIKLNNDLKLRLRTNIINSDRSGVSESGDNIESGLNYILTLAPYINAADRDANGFVRPKQELGSVSSNPLFLKEITSLSSNTNRLIGSANLVYSPFKFLEVDYRLGVDYYLTETDREQQNATAFEDANTTEREVVLLQPQGFFTRNTYTNQVINNMIDVYLKFDFNRDFGIDLPI
jgi:TonB-dependent SusC/RagA subfamily outer membrane receptor